VRLRIFDGFVLACTVALTVYCGIRVYSGGGPSLKLSVRGDDGNWVYPAERGERFEVSGPLGITMVELRNGEARVLSSPCVNQTCVAAGAIHSRGQWIACLPNRVFLNIEGGSASADGVDGSAW
jgi:hypothetical protein